jgi:hypothetical protein
MANHVFYTKPLSTAAVALLCLTPLFSQPLWSMEQEIEKGSKIAFKLTRNEQKTLISAHSEELNGPKRDKIKALLLHDKGWTIPRIADVLFVKEEEIKNNLNNASEIIKQLCKTSAPVTLEFNTPVVPITLPPLYVYKNGEHQPADENNPEDMAVYGAAQVAVYRGFPMFKFNALPSKENALKKFRPLKLAKTAEEIEQHVKEFGYSHRQLIFYPDDLDEQKMKTFLGYFKASTGGWNPNVIILMMGGTLPEAYNVDNIQHRISEGKAPPNLCLMNGLEEAIASELISMQLNVFDFNRKSTYLRRSFGFMQSTLKEKLCGEPQKLEH